MKERFNLLLTKYVGNTISREEYEEFLALLEKPEFAEILDGFLEKSWEDEKKPENDTNPTSFRPKPKKIKMALPTLAKIAASVVFLVGLAVWLMISSTGREEYITYSAGYGEIRDVSLPDGSMVSLNANSELKWLANWESLGERKAVLNGEAFFNIKGLQDKTPFRVETGKVSLEVIGTSFNVDNRTENVKIYLDEGRLNVHLAHEELPVIEMLPGDRVNVDVEKNEIGKETNSSLSEAAAWKTGILNFKDLKFSDVLDKLTQIYGKSFVCEDKGILSKELYLGVPYSDWDTVRQALELSLDIRFEENGDNVKIQSN